jgi:hypothetical protein
VDAPAVGTSVLARSDTEHHILIRKDSGYGIHASGQSFAEKNHVRADAFVLHAQQLACPAKALSVHRDSGQYLHGESGAPYRLDLIAYE